jgi:protocatechuate 3,4-dioxygenase beta subunit
MSDEADGCSLTAEQAEGPYYIDARLIRRDITEGKTGVPLRLGIRVRDVAGCAPIAGAAVDVWHCDALGIYSGFEATSKTAGEPADADFPDTPTDEHRYLRGTQITDSDGIVEFQTIYPGWYRGRTVHIHAKVLVDGQVVLTTQLYFDEDHTSQVYRSEPYASDPGRDTFNDTDSIFDDGPLLSLSRDGDAYRALITLDVQP